MRIQMLWTLVSYSPSMYATSLRLLDCLGVGCFCLLEFLLGVLLFVATAPGLCDFCFNLYGILYYRYGNKKTKGIYSRNKK